MKKTFLEKESYTGIEIIDNQHLEIIRIGNDLGFLIENSKNRDTIISGLDEFITAVEKHFIYEESLFKNFDYKQAERHIEMHRFYMTSLLEAKKKFVELNVELSGSVANFLNEWVKSHIISLDLTFGNEYLKTAANSVNSI
ncbi:MAG: hemerythrin family protein [Fusobacteriaceae bacterium]|nr:hemerythrin family protein [Fusobacteriaceae bacterium]